MRTFQDLLDYEERAAKVVAEQTLAEMSLNGFRMQGFPEIVEANRKIGEAAAKRLDDAIMKVLTGG